MVSSIAEPDSLSAEPAPKIPISTAFLAPAFPAIATPLPPTRARRPLITEGGSDWPSNTAAASGLPPRLRRVFVKLSGSDIVESFCNVSGFNCDITSWDSLSPEVTIS